MTPTLAAAAFASLLRLLAPGTGLPPATTEWCPTLAPGSRAPAPQTVGVASWYGPRFVGRRTASGERFDSGALTAAHRSWRMGTRARVTCLRSGKSVVVRINDRLPHKTRVIDLSRAAAEKLGLLRRGLGRVRVEVLAE